MDTQNESLKNLDLVAQAIFDKKGMNILALDLIGLSTMTDYIIIAEGNVDRHLRALSSSIIDALQQRGIKPLHIEGYRDNDWVIVDFGDIVVHLFTPEMREKYAIEELWREGRIIDLHIKISHEEQTGFYV